jgi:hypothetical protein
MGDFTPPRVDIAGGVSNLIQQYQRQRVLAKAQELETARKNALSGLMQGGDPTESIRRLMGIGDLEGAQTLAQAVKTMQGPQLTPGDLLAHQDRLSAQGIERDKLKALYPWLAADESGAGAAAPAGETAAAPRPMSMGDVAADKKFAAGDYLSWLQGGKSESEHALQALQHVKEGLDKAPDSMLTPIIGMQVKKSLAGNEDMATLAARYGNSEEFNFAAGHQRAVVASLRPLIGARAAQQLFQSVLSATYDPMAGHKENSRRIGLVMDNIRKATEAKQSMSEYFQKNHTLAGYTGQRFDPENFDPTEGLDTAPGSAEGGPPAPPPPEAVQKLNDALANNPDPATQLKIKQAFERQFLKGGRGGADQYLTEGTKPNAWGLQ